MRAARSGWWLSLAVIAACTTSRSDTAAPPTPHVPGAPAMLCVATVEKTKPLTIHVSLRQAPDASGPLLVPRVLEPLGTFVTLSIVDGAGAVAFEIQPLKFTPKVAPSDARAYVEVDPGYAWGRTFVVDGAALAAGRYQLQIAFSNRDFQGPADRPMGVLACNTSVAFEMTP